ncbi:MAG: hypothetical protein ABJF10_11160 [Chthoniobacter sp.]|uniref:hypothetical protein n=1 Tax=Chthoniobacter sp. TaxID=2510640 RepID=UPI0032AA4713
MGTYFKAPRTRRSWRGEEKMSRGKSTVVVLAVVAFFVAFAGLMTLLAPTYSILLRRESEGVSVRVERRLLWWIPIRGQTVEKLQGVKASTERPEATDPHDGRDLQAPETVGNLVLAGAAGEARATASPENLDEVQRAIEDFLRGGPSELRLRAVTNWKFAVIAPGILAGLGGLLLLLFLWDVLGWLRGKKSNPLPRITSPRS